MVKKINIKKNVSDKLMPKFNYTLNIKSYLNFRYKQKKNTIDQLFGNSKVIFYNHARVGLRVLLSSISDKTLNIGVQAYTCHTVFQSIAKAGHNIIFLDLNEQFKLDQDFLRKRITDIDVLIITHTFGFPEDIDDIKSIIGNKIIIEDCSHAFLSKYKDKYTGTLGDAAIFSTGLGKFPSLGHGGFCVVNNYDRFPFIERENFLIPKGKMVSSIKDFLKILLLTFFLKPPLYGMFTYRIGKSMDTKFDFGNKFSFYESKGYEWVKKLLNNYLELYQSILEKNIKNKKTLSIFLEGNYFSRYENDCNIAPNYYLTPFLIKQRDEIFNKLLEADIETGKHFSKSILWASEFGYKKNECPNVERIVKEILVVPTHVGIKEETLNKIASVLEN